VVSDSYICWTCGADYYLRSKTLKHFSHWTWGIKHNWHRTGFQSTLINWRQRKINNVNKDEISKRKERWTVQSRNKLKQYIQKGINDRRKCHGGIKITKVSKQEELGRKEWTTGGQTDGWMNRETDKLTEKSNSIKEWWKERMRIREWIKQRNMDKLNENGTKEERNQETFYQRVACECSRLSFAPAAPATTRKKRRETERGSLSFVCLVIGCKLKEKEI